MPNAACCTPRVVLLQEPSPIETDELQQARFDKIYRSYFPNTKCLPTRTRMQAGGTPFDCGLEIDAIGYIPQSDS